MPGTQREVPEGWPRQADPLGHLQAALSQVVRAQAGSVEAWPQDPWRAPLGAANRLGPLSMAAGTQNVSAS